MKRGVVIIDLGGSGGNCCYLSVKNKVIFEEKMNSCVICYQENELNNKYNRQVSEFHSICIYNLLNFLINE